MNTRVRTGLHGGLVLSAFATAGALACETPSMVNVPDGTTATMEQMVAAQQEVKDYVAAMEDYLACVNEELEAAGEDAPEEYKALMIERHNSAVGEMEAVAAAFNEQVRAYRAAHAEE
ncbi:MAG TPA: hypothetical protein VF329_08980 [Gammaproteobacteria bacterium]